MADNVVDSVIIEIESTTEKADKGIDKTIEGLTNMKKALNGINTKKLRQEMESFAEFQQKLKSSFQNITVSGNSKELVKQIAQAEAQLDKLLGKENKLMTVSGINENSKQYRSLQYDIAQVCATLDQLYAAMEKINIQKPLNFWEKPGWQENLQNYGTTDTSNLQTINTVKPERYTKEAVSEAAPAEEKAVQSTEKLTGKLQALKIVAQQMKETFSNLRSQFSAGAGSQKFNADMQQMIDGMNQARLVMKQMESGDRAFNSTAYEKAARELAAASAQMKNYKSSLAGATAETNRLKTALLGIGSTIKSAFGKMGPMVASACKTVKAHLSKLGSAFSAFGKTLNSFFRLATFMMFRKIITAVFKNTKEGFDLLARYSASKGTEFNKNVSMLQSSLKTLGNSLIVAFEPVFNVVAPILNALIQKLITATNALAQFFSALTGKSSFTKAKTAVGNYAKGIDKATASAKKLATATLGIDELNILQDNSKDGAEAGGTNPTDAFETVPIDPKYFDFIKKLKEMWESANFSELGSMLTGKLNAAMESLQWDQIKQTAWKIAHSIATFINGFVVDLNWELLGATIGEGLNTALIFANTLLDTIDWGLIGSSIAEALNSAVKTINWPSIGNLLSTGLKSAFEAFNNFAETFDFIKFGESIVSAFGGFFDTFTWGSISETLSNSVTSLLDTLTGIVSGIEWTSIPQYIMTAIGDFFAGFDFEGIAQSLGQLLGSAVKGAIELVGSLWDLLVAAWGDLSSYFKSYIEEAGGNIIKGLWSGITNALANVANWIFENVFSPFIEGFKSAFGIASPSKVMEIMGNYIVYGVVVGITDSWKAVIQFFNDGLENIISVFSKAWENLKNMTSAAWERIKTLFSDAWAALKQGTLEAWQKLKDDFFNGMENILKAVKTGWENIKMTFKTALKAVVKIITDTKWFEIGWDIVRGIWKGISDGWSWLIDQIKGFAKSLLDAAKSVLGIHSPSRKFAEIGSFTVSGFNEGIAKNAASSIKTLKKWFSSFDNVDVNLQTRFTINDDALKSYQPNYGRDFTNDVIMQRVQKEIAVTGAVQSNFNVDNTANLKNAIIEALGDLGILPVVETIAQNTRETADKDFTVNIGDREINRASERGRFMRGRQLITDDI